MKRELSGRRVLITGASSGIGQSLAEQLAAKGARLALAARSEGKLRELAASLKTDVAVIPTDVAQEPDRVRLIGEVQARFGGLDVLINNAGIASWAHFSDSTEDVLRKIMEVNFFGPAHLMKLAQPLLVDGQQPAIVNISSMCGRKAMPGWSEYSASKYALCGLTEALRGEFARYDIDVLLIVPGLTKSSFREHFLQTKGRAKIEFDKGMAPSYVAGQIIKSLERNKTETVLGSEARWVLLANKFFPRLTDWLLARKMKQLYANG
jgi:short-subunit dehydrogenase